MITLTPIRDSCCTYLPKGQKYLVIFWQLSLDIVDFNMDRTKWREPIFKSSALSKMAHLSRVGLIQTDDLHWGQRPLASSGNQELAETYHQQKEVFINSWAPSDFVNHRAGLPDVFFKPKILIWVNFGGSCNGRCWYILWKLGPFCDLLLYYLYGYLVSSW
jgi:hypothetical protein